MDIGKVIAFVQTPRLLNGLWIRARHDNRHDDLVNPPFIVRVRASTVNRQRRTTSIHPDMEFRATLGSVYWTRACVFATPRGWTRLAMDGLPGPLDPWTRLVKLGAFAHQALKNAALSPFLKPTMPRG